MGKIIAIWSDVKKSGKSVITYMLAKKIREMSRKDIKILVCCLNFKYSSLYRLFGINTGDTGLEDLVNYQFFENGNSEVLIDIIPVNAGIYFLGSYRSTNSYVQKNTEKFSNLLEELKDSFDIIIVDTVSGKENILTNIVLQKAQIILKLFIQDNESITKLNNIREENAPYDHETIYIVSKYRNIYPKLGDIKRRYSLNKVYTMEYCETLQEMKNRDSLHLYLQRETNCNDSIKQVSQHILETLRLLPEGIKEKPARYIKSLFEAFYRI